MELDQRAENRCLPYRRDMADHGSACLPQDPLTSRAMVPRNTDANNGLTTRASIETATSGSALTLSSLPDQAVGRRSPSRSVGGGRRNG